MLVLTGCNEQDRLAKEKLAELVGDGAGSTAVVAEGATSKEDQWEYLVVSFGKTSFVEIEKSIKVGSSKLVAFQEFADLLAGHEGIDLQSKLDLLGRFGWELVDTIGIIGGDQQLLLKRQRLLNRIEIEQEALRKLSVILKEESERREAQVRALMEELESLRQQRAAGSDDRLIEMDAHEKRGREQAAELEATSKISDKIRKVGSAYVEKTSISALVIDISTRETEKKQMDYSGSITLQVDATEALLFEDNRYRSSSAQALARQIANQAISEAGFRKRSSLADFSLRVEVSVNYKGKINVVASTYESVNIPGFEGYWGRGR